MSSLGYQFKINGNMYLYKNLYKCLQQSTVTIAKYYKNPNIHEQDNG